jgi:hypothetical protein
MCKRLKSSHYTDEYPTRVIIKKRIDNQTITFEDIRDYISPDLKSKFKEGDKTAKSTVDDLLNKANNLDLTELRDENKQIITKIAEAIAKVEDIYKSIFIFRYMMMLKVGIHTLFSQLLYYLMSEAKNLL